MAHAFEARLFVFARSVALVAAIAGIDSSQPASAEPPNPNATSAAAPAIDSRPISPSIVAPVNVAPRATSGVTRDSKRHIYTKTDYDGANRPTALSPHTAEILRQAGIAPSDRARARTFLEDRLARTSASAPIVKIAPRRVKFAEPVVASLTKDRIAALIRGHLAQITSTNRSTGLATSGGLVAPIGIGSTSATTTTTVVPAPTIVSTHSGWPDPHVLVHGASILVLGDHFLAGGTPQIILQMGVCGSIALQPTDLTDTSFTVIMPEVPAFATAWPAAIVVGNSAGVSRTAGLTYRPPMDLMVATIDVSDHKQPTGGHAMGDGGIGLQEGHTMFTSPGDERNSCCDGFLGGHGDNGTDTYLPNVDAINGWQVYDTEALSAGCDNMRGFNDDPIPYHCAWFDKVPGLSFGADNLYFFKDLVQLFNQWQPARTGVADGQTFHTDGGLYMGQTSLSPHMETRVHWTYDGGWHNSYTLMWIMIGPHAERIFPWQAPTHGTVCEN
ncbi:MAG: hypothetical protein M3N13_11015 [Candidatus Eremiobacteraeota bacterium]|nr:hypothetical protein [Candidatus Eremiobacteraeota bacterium]